MKKAAKVFIGISVVAAIGVSAYFVFESVFDVTKSPNEVLKSVTFKENYNTSEDIVLLGDSTIVEVSPDEGYIVASKEVLVDEITETHYGVYNTAENEMTFDFSSLKYSILAEELFIRTSINASGENKYDIIHESGAVYLAYDDEDTMTLTDGFIVLNGEQRIYIDSQKHEFIRVDDSYTRKKYDGGHTHLSQDYFIEIIGDDVIDLYTRSSLSFYKKIDISSIHSSTELSRSTHILSNGNILIQTLNQVNQYEENYDFIDGVGSTSNKIIVKTYSIDLKRAIVNEVDVNYLINTLYSQNSATGYNEFLTNSPSNQASIMYFTNKLLRDNESYVLLDDNLNVMVDLSATFTTSSIIKVADSRFIVNYGAANNALVDQNGEVIANGFTIAYNMLKFDNKFYNLLADKTLFTIDSNHTILGYLNSSVISYETTTVESETITNYYRNGELVECEQLTIIDSVTYMIEVDDPDLGYVYQFYNSTGEHLYTQVAPETATISSIELEKFTLLSIENKVTKLVKDIFA